MSFETSLVTFLKSKTAITALVGNRIFPNVIPQWTKETRDRFGEPYPALRYVSEISERHRHLGGRGTLREAEVQIDCYSTSYVQVKLLAKAVGDALDTFRGDMAGTYVDEIVQAPDLSSYESAADASDVGTDRETLQFTIWHQE